jgi:uncharacterized protein HemX
MNSTNALTALIAVLVLAGGAYYFMATSAGEMGKTATVETEVTSQAEGAAVPLATDSVDDFAAAMQAELDASASAIKALDQDVDASVDGVVNSVNTVYDPSTL